MNETKLVTPEEIPGLLEEFSSCVGGPCILCKNALRLIATVKAERERIAAANARAEQAERERDKWDAEAKRLYQLALQSDGSMRSYRIRMESSAELEWQPIETAPKDRTWVLCTWKNSVSRFGIPVVLYWHGECWTNIDPALTPVVKNALKPTHWMPLPPLPDVDSEDQAE